MDTAVPIMRFPNQNIVPKQLADGYTVSLTVLGR